MSQIVVIKGGNPLYGDIHVNGAKNAALPLLTATLLSNRSITIENVPCVGDVHVLLRILRTVGASVKLPDDVLNNSTRVSLRTDVIHTSRLEPDLIGKLRAGFWVIGPLVARFGSAELPFPGGCNIGKRPIDLHLLALRQLGATTEVTGNGVRAHARSNGLVGGRITFPSISVGATCTAIMAACLADGTTVIENAAREPEIVALSEMLNMMGAKIEGAGSHTINICGVANLGGGTFRVIPDRIEAGTYAIAVANTGGRLKLSGIEMSHLTSVINALVQAGVRIIEDGGKVIVERECTTLRSVDIDTAPYPGFPTDLQPQFMTLMATVDGVSLIRETVFENRFQHVKELTRLGANITISGDTATINGVNRLTSASVCATDLRAAAALVIAGLAITDKTEISNIHHLDRGYTQFVENLADCGAMVQRRGAEAKVLALKDYV